MVPPPELKQAYDLAFDCTAIRPIEKRSPSGLLDLHEGTLRNGVRILFESVRPKVLLSAFESVNIFHLCGGCGKIYWEGSHLGRVKGKMSELLRDDPSGRTLYDQKT